jgi:hypothetical protein
MEIVIFGVCIACSFVLGRLTCFKKDTQTERLANELRIMTDSRDRWREKYLVRAMRDKLKEMECKKASEVED